MKERTSVFVGSIENYIDEELVKRPHPVFYQMEEYAKEHSIPIVSAATGAVLKNIFKNWKLDQIWELGTGIGYSTLWIYLGSPNSKITTIDRNQNQAALLDTYAKEIIGEKSNQLNRISAWILDYMFDHIEVWSGVDAFFIDCDKVTYPALWDLLVHHSKPGTKFIFDNVLWHGRLMDLNFQNPSDIAMRSLWERVKTSGFEYTLFPVGDGILVVEKG